MLNIGDSASYLVLGVASKNGGSDCSCGVVDGGFDSFSAALFRFLIISLAAATAWPYKQENTIYEIVIHYITKKS